LRNCNISFIIRLHKVEKVRVSRFRHCVIQGVFYSHSVGFESLFFVGKFATYIIGIRQDSQIYITLCSLSLVILLQY